MVFDSATRTWHWRSSGLESNDEAAECNETGFLAHLFALWMRKHTDVNHRGPHESEEELLDVVKEEEEEEDDEMMEEEEVAINPSKSGRKSFRTDHVPPPYL